MDDKTIKSYATIVKYLKTPPTSAAELYLFLKALTGEDIVFKNVCSDHNSPWDYIWNSYRIDLPNFKQITPRNIVGLGPRGGFKTLSEAKLIAAETLLKPGCRSISMAAIEKQANRGYEYVTRYLKHPLILEMGLIKRMLKTQLELNNGSDFQQVIATISGVNSAHVPKLRIDEVDLIDPTVVNEAIMMANSMKNYTAQIAYTSTRKTSDGTMSDLITKAENRKDYKTISWCYKETSEKCPDTRSGTKEEIYEVEDIYNPGETVIVKAFEGCKDCVLLPSCRGDLKRATGTTPIEDSIGEYLSLDRSSWIAQKECRPPLKTNLFFSEWHNKFNTLPTIGYNSQLPVDLAFDFTNGGDSPTVCQVWQENAEGDNFLLAGLEYRYKASNIVGEDILDFLKSLGITSTRLQVGDSAQMQEIRNLNAFNSFFRISPTKKILRKEGWPICRRTVKDNTGRRRLFVSEQYAANFIIEIEHATRKRSDPDDIGAMCEDHQLDAWRYREVKVHYQGMGEPNIRLFGTPEEFNKNGNIITNSKDQRPLSQSIWDYMRQTGNDD